MPRDKDFLLTLERGLKVITSFGNNKDPQTISSIAAQLGLSRASARRFLLTLQELGYVSCKGTRFRLTAKILELSHAFLANLGYEDIIIPHMEELTRDVGEASSAAVLDGDEVLYVARIPVHRIMSLNVLMGSRLPAYCTSTGRVLLANLSEEKLSDFLDRIDPVAFTHRTVTDKTALRKIIQEVRDKQYCIVDQELELGLTSCSIPVRDRKGKLLFALNLSCLASSNSISDMEDKLLPMLGQCRNKICRDLP